MGLLMDKDKGLLNNDSIEEARKGKIVYLELDEIQMNPDNIGQITEEEIQKKYNSILEVGLLQPLLVKRTEKGIFLNTGHKRFMALKRINEQRKSYKYLGKELIGTAPCQYLYDDLDEAQFDIVAICSNAHHPDSKEEKREKVWRMHQYYQQMIVDGRKPAGREREWITAMTGISDGTVKSLLAGFNAQEILSEEDTLENSTPPKDTDISKQIVRKLNKMNKYLQDVDLTALSEFDRRSLNELLRDVQDTLEALIYA